MKALWDWFVSDLAIWIIAGFAGWKAIEGVREQKLGQTLFSIVIGMFAYYFVKNPETVLKWGADVWGKMFGK